MEFLHNIILQQQTMRTLNLTNYYLMGLYLLEKGKLLILNLIIIIKKMKMIMLKINKIKMKVNN